MNQNKRPRVDGPADCCCIQLQKFSIGDGLCEMKMVDTVKYFVMLCYHKNLQGDILRHARDDRISHKHFEIVKQDP